MHKTTRMQKIVILSMIFGAFTYVYTAFYIGNRVYVDNKEPSDVIIVLGAKSFINNKVNPCVESRVKHATDLYKNGYAPKIIMTGGSDMEFNKIYPSEAEEMKKMAVSMDVNSKDILVEDESTSTFENLLLSKKIMEENNFQKAIIVTEPFHSPRASLVAEKLGMNYAVSPTLTSICWNKYKFLSRFFLREPLVLIGYKLLGQV